MVEMNQKGYAPEIVQITYHEDIATVITVSLLPNLREWVSSMLTDKSFENEEVREGAQQVLLHCLRIISDIHDKEIAIDLCTLDNFGYNQMENTWQIANLSYSYVTNDEENLLEDYGDFLEGFKSLVNDTDISFDYFLPFLEKIVRYTKKNYYRRFDDYKYLLSIGYFATSLRNRKSAIEDTEQEIPSSFESPSSQETEKSETPSSQEQVPDINDEDLESVDEDEYMRKL